MASSCAEREYDNCQQISSEQTASDCLSTQEESTEEIRKEDHEIDSKEFESELMANGFLRSKDSDEEYNSETEVKISSDDKQSTNESKSEQKKRTDSKDTTVVVSLNSTGDSVDKIHSSRGGDKSRSFKWRDNPRVNKDIKRATNWGESVGINDSKGRPKRLVCISEVKNYIPLRIRYKSEFNFYFNLIDSRYPQRYRSYGSDKQRWRMRYNVFVDGLFDGTPEKMESLFHVGEIIIYFDIAHHLSHPYYTNCSFYANYKPLDRSVDTTKLTRLIFRLHDVLTSNVMLQLKFPVESRSFRNTDQLYNKFMVRQKELMDELHLIQSRHWLPSSKWQSIDIKSKKQEKSVVFNQLSIDRRSNKRSDERRRRRPQNTSQGKDRRLSNAVDNGYSTNTLREEQHNTRLEDRIDRRFVNDSENRRQRNPSNRRKADHKFALNSWGESTASTLNQNWIEDWDQSNNLSLKPNQRRNRNSDQRLNNEEVRPRGDRREERRSRPKTRRN